MPRRLRLALLVVAAAAALPAAAAAKEIDSVTITGPGLSGSISLAGGHESLDVDTPIARLVEESGFFPEVFDTAPDPTLADRPKGDLGPRYVAAYVLPSEETGELARVEQELYPYAKPYPVTHVREGRDVWTGRTHGGWMLARSELKSTLVRAGLPRVAPVRRGVGSSMSLWAGGGAGAAALAAGLAFFVFRMRRPKPR